MRTKDEDRDDDGSDDDDDVGVRTGRILALGTARLNRTAAGTKRGRTSGDVLSDPQLWNFSPPPEAHFVSAEEAGTT